MRRSMKNSHLPSFAQELVKVIKTAGDLSTFSAELAKLTGEAALNAELDAHLGYRPHEVKGKNSGNSRNGSSPKKLEGQTRITGMDEPILTRYAKGMSTRDISSCFQDMYGVEVSASLVSKVTNAVMERVIEWQNRPLDSVSPIVYLDGIVLKIRQDKRVIKKSMYLALGINTEGHKALLGLWLSENEGAKFWLSVLTELKNRGVEQVLIACVDGLSGFPEAINTVYPNANIQRCIIHMVRNSLKYVSWKDYKAVTGDRKKIYRSATETEALAERDIFAQNWDRKYPQIGKSWRAHWPDLITLFNYPPAIRKVIDTTNAIESLNSVIRKSVKTRKLFPNDESAIKVVFLAVEAASKKWTMSIQDCLCPLRVEISDESLYD